MLRQELDAAHRRAQLCRNESGNVDAELGQVCLQRSCTGDCERFTIVARERKRRTSTGSLQSTFESRKLSDRSNTHTHTRQLRPDIVNSTGAYSTFSWRAVGCAFNAPIAGACAEAKEFVDSLEQIHNVFFSFNVAVVWLGDAIDLFEPPYVRGGALPISAKAPPTAMPGFFQNTTNLAIVIAAGGVALLLVGIVVLCVCIKKRRAKRVGGVSAFDYVAAASGIDVNRDLYRSAIHDDMAPLPSLVARPDVANDMPSE